MSKKSKKDFSVNSHINVNIKSVSISDALNHKKTIETIFPDEEAYLVINRREILRLIQKHYHTSFEMFSYLRFGSASKHRAIASSFKCLFLNHRCFVITGEQYKKVKQDEQNLKKVKRKNI